MIVGVLANSKDPGQRSLADIEQAVRVAGREFEQALRVELVAESSRQPEAEWPRGPGCGRRMEAKGRRPKRLVTPRGEVKLKRAYSYCGE